jgi:predicted Zn finger-like uncharacterized protein
MSAFSTSCPNCGAAFIVTPQQLAVANGSVRCGSCMHIFLAAQHRSDKPAAQSDNIFDFKLGGGEPQTSTPAPGKSSKESEFSDQFLNLNTDNQAFAEAMGEEESSAYDDEQWAKNLLESLDNDDDEPVRGNKKPAAEPDEIELSPEFAELENNLLAGRTKEAPAPARPSELDELAAALDASLVAEPDNERKRMLSSIQAEPLEFTFRRFHWSQVITRTFFILASLIALAGIGAQFAYFNFDRFARDDRYRPWYALACEQLKCTLPSRDDITQIQATNLVVRSHPKIANALIVDAMLTNRASYEQPYPELELIFTNMQGQVVAARRLKPQEYLGSSDAAPAMPSYEPIHMALEIADPGPTATGYRIVIHPAGKA